MLHLGKKITMKDETLEAYSCDCFGCGCTCGGCYCSAGRSAADTQQSGLLTTGNNNTGMLYEASTYK